MWLHVPDDPPDVHPDDLLGLELAAGVGMLGIGYQLATPRARIMGYVEREAAAAAALVGRMADQALDRAPVWDDLRTFDGRAWRGIVDFLVAGYPCQPFSQAGRRRGADDERHLWPEIARIIAESRPREVLLENVAHHLRLGAEQVIHDLGEMDYRVAAGLFSTREVGGAHIRRRLFLLAHADVVGGQAGEQLDTAGEGGGALPGAPGGALADPDGHRLQALGGEWSVAGRVPEPPGGAPRSVPLP